jgi:polyketide-type polyunsaturated fatty acid synthase PfaA
MEENQFQSDLFNNEERSANLNDRIYHKPIAIVGMAGIFPKANNLQEFWNNIVNKIDCITDVPASHWNIEDYYSPDPKEPDKTYCKRGGFIPDIDFNPLEFGLPPNILEVTDVSQLLSLVVAKQAMEDAGYGESRTFDRSKTGVVLGVGGGQKLTTPLTTRLQFPIWDKVLKSHGLSDPQRQAIIEKIKLAYIGWEENSFPGMLGNVIAGRIANRLDLGGINCVVDAACASSLAALQMAISELESNRSDMIIAGGVDTDNSIFMYMCFSKTPAFSKQQQIRPFDQQSDGMLVGEGIGMIVLKRLEDAQRDGDRVYATIQGIGTSSDGKFKSIYAPRAGGQALALRRAYQDAGFTPASVGLIEAHGTATVVGDQAEFAGLQEVFSEANPPKQSIALGSVKSQIGHTKSAAGIASLIKVALALHHKILPPTINVTKPNQKLNIEDSPFYLNTETSPWFPSDEITPRRAGVSSFGFGGTNFHVVLEEANRDHETAYRLHPVPASILIYAATPAQLLIQCETLLLQLKSEAGAQNYQTLIKDCHSLKLPRMAARIGFVAASLGEACEVLQSAIALLKEQQTLESWEHPKGIYYRACGIASQGKVVALFAGQGSQYLNMGKELAINFPQLRQSYALMDRILEKDGLSPISSIVFPPPVFEPEQKQAQATRLHNTENAQPAIAAFSLGLYKLLQQAGFRPNFVAGHSFGELTALWAAGVFRDEDYFSLVKMRGQAMASPADENCDAGAMLAVQGDITQIGEIVKEFPGVTVANWNANNQVVLAGSSPPIAQIQPILTTRGYRVIPLPVSAAFHTPLVGYAQKPFADALNAVTFNSPQIPVYSNTTTNPYPHHPQAIQKTLADHLLNPVRFKEEIENIYAAGGSIFVEFGPKNILTQLVKNILEGKPHVAVALNLGQRSASAQEKIVPSKDRDRQLREAVLQLRVIGLNLQDIDPYQLEIPVRLQTYPELNVKLNGNNYVSEKTKSAFVQALNYHPLPVEKTIELIPTEPINQTNLSTNNGKCIIEKEKSQESLDHSKSPHPGVQVSNLSISHPNNLENMEPSLNQYQTEIFASTERMMMGLQEHQAQLLKVHEEYLKHQAQYSQQCLYLMQQQYAFLAGNSVAHPVPDVSNTLMTVPLEVPNSHVLATNNPARLQTDLSSISTSFTPPLPENLDKNIEELPTDTGVKVATEPNILNAPIEASEPVAPQVTVPAPEVDLTPLKTALLEVVSEKTGYPTAMLELEMDMEADLGIDSIKRVEILGAMQELFPDLPSVTPEDIGELRTLGQIVEYMGKKKIVP